MATVSTPQLSMFPTHRSTHHGSVALGVDFEIQSSDDWSDERDDPPTRKAEVLPVAAALAQIDADVDKWTLPALARGLIRGYDYRWRDAHRKIEVVEVESTYASPLYNPATSRASKTFGVAGKIDKLVHHDGWVLYDHKTTSQQNDISDPNSTYWRQLIVEAQTKHYELLLLANGVKLDRVVWDVVRKPGIRPKKLSKKALAEVVTLGTYCTFDVSQTSINAVQQTGHENAELFECRVAEETIDNPDKYFQRRGVPRLREELAEYAGELWDIAAEIREARKTQRWYRNSGACMNYGAPCPFLGICSRHDDERSDNWTRREQVHAELELDGDGRNVLTHSRLRCFQTCRRKHFLQYELGLVRINEENREPLFFGQLWHQALDAYWAAASRKGVGDEHCDEKSANAVG